MKIYAKIGSKTIQIDATIDNTAEAVRDHLKPVYPEVDGAAIKTKTTGEGDAAKTVYQFVPKPGKKG